MADFGLEVEEDLEEGGGRRGLEECLAILQLDEGVWCADAGGWGYLCAVSSR